MANYKNRYMYETSPRKLKPEYNPHKEKTNKKRNIQNSKKTSKQKANIKERKTKSIIYLVIAFAILFGMGYQNSKINEQFSELKQSEKKLALIQKENEQLRVSIENTLNLANLEQMAKEQMGMQKATTKQTRYVKLPKKDYVEVASEQIIKNDNKNFFDNILDFIQGVIR